MCNEVILENDEMLMFFADCNKNQKLRNKAIDDHAHALKLVLDCQKT